MNNVPESSNTCAVCGGIHFGSGKNCPYNTAICGLCSQPLNKHDDFGYCEGGAPEIVSTPRVSILDARDATIRTLQKENGQLTSDLKLCEWAKGVVQSAAGDALPWMQDGPIWKQRAESAESELVALRGELKAAETKSGIANVVEQCEARIKVETEARESAESLVGELREKLEAAEKEAKHQRENFYTAAMDRDRYMNKHTAAESQLLALRGALTDVKRFDLVAAGFDEFKVMEACEEGDWVKFDDVAAVLAGETRP